MTQERKRTILIATVIIGLLALAYGLLPGFRTEVNVAAGHLARGDIEPFRDYLLGFGVWAPIVSALLMVFQSLIAPLPAFVITFTNGLLFGTVWGAALSWSSAMLGAALCYAIARVYGRPVVERFVSPRSLSWFDGFVARYGTPSILIARLIPVVSFDLVSYGAGLTAIRFWPFFIATGLGQLPATILYSWLGENVTGSIAILFWAFIIVIAGAVIAATWRRRTESTAERS